MSTLDEILRVAKTAAESSADVLMEHFGHAEVRQKSTRNLVTQADIQSEETVVELVEKEFPGHRVLREEGASTGGAQDDHLWIIDPLDATNNYAHGIPHFAVSIGYAERGEVKVGVVFDPVRREMFTAARGRGASLNGQPIQVSSRRGLEDSIIATGFYYERGEWMQRTLDAVRDLFHNNVRGIRRFGAASLDLSWVACGRFEGFFEYKLGPWDYAAGSLIVQEAGGLCCDRQGNDLAIDSGSVLAANPFVFSQLRQVVRWPKVPST